MRIVICLQIPTRTDHSPSEVETAIVKEKHHKLLGSDEIQAGGEAFLS
jgi:hypothetical protein